MNTSFHIFPRGLILSLPLLVGLTWLSMPQTQGVDFYVDTEVDEVDANPGDGICASASVHCSLRAAVMEANALPGDDVIHLYAGAPGVPGPSLTIQGSGEDGAETGDLDIIGTISIV
ncbi:MAG TPA: CSLREA domain-containing protein, partial [Anaerolineales bacterium]|nr:CSLREA domain-containing protein [Anaerolineales bacterium]